MRGWARHWQQHGIPTTLVSLCNSSWLNGHHQRNADDMQALARELELEAVVYAGFSAGGLAAYLAAGTDPTSIGYLGLDSVDSGDLAESSNTPLSVPALFLMAKPSACNARGNFRPVLERWKDYRVVHFSEATHCHFELPYDKRCGWICGRADEEVTGRIQSELLERTTDWLQNLDQDLSGC